MQWVTRLGFIKIIYYDKIVGQWHAAEIDEAPFQSGATEAAGGYDSRAIHE
jgi:hypothetical protein